MAAQLLDGIPVALELLLGKEQMHLRMAGAAQADRLPHRRAVEESLVSLIGVTRPRDQVMPRERLDSGADGTLALHAATSAQSQPRASRLAVNGPQFCPGRKA